MPLLSTAGVNRALRRMIMQVDASSTAEPLDPVTLQPCTRPSAPTWRVKATHPRSPRARAESG